MLTERSRIVLSPTPFLLRIGSPGIPFVFLCRANAGRQTQYGGCWMAGSASTPVSTQAPGQMGALAHPPPFTQVVGLPWSNNAWLDNWLPRWSSGNLCGLCCRISQVRFAQMLHFHFLKTQTKKNKKKLNSKTNVHVILRWVGNPTHL